MTRSGDDTTIAAKIRLRYKKAGILKGWNRERYSRLCKMLNVTVAELGYVCAIKPGDVTRYMKSNRFPPTVSLHLAVIESVYLEQSCGRPWEPIVALDLIK